MYVYVCVPATWSVKQDQIARGQHIRKWRKLMKKEGVTEYRELALIHLKFLPIVFGSIGNNREFLFTTSTIGVSLA
jgi:hypothetical protein